MTQFFSKNGVYMPLPYLYVIKLNGNYAVCELKCFEALCSPSKM